jgi:hypothetical protein
VDEPDAPSGQLCVPDVVGVVVVVEGVVTVDARAACRMLAWWEL